jgi:K+-transporting ATPase KdpF subunit
LHTCVSATESGKGEKMSLESIIMIVISALLMVYLLFALLCPEKF